MNRKASDWQFLWQQQDFRARKMCRLHHQMFQRLVSMTTVVSGEMYAHEILFQKPIGLY